MSLREKDPMSLRRLLVFAPNDLFTKRPASALMNSIGNGGPALLMVGESSTPGLSVRAGTQTRAATRYFNSWDLRAYDGVVASRRTFRFGRSRQV